MLEAKEKYLDFIDRAKADCKALAEYSCPHCNATLYSLRPPDGEVWDSACSCPYCSRLHFRATQADGTVDVTKMG